jgi:hypothetical protein
MVCLSRHGYDGDDVNAAIRNLILLQPFFAFPWRLRAFALGK